MSRVPMVGVGIGYRAPLHREVLAHLPELDLLEVTTEAFLRDDRPLHALSTLKTCVPHSLQTSVGSEVDPAYLEKVARVVELVDPPWHSDHLAFTSAGGVQVGHLAPVPQTKEALERVARNVRLVRERIPRPFALENVTRPFRWPDDEMEEHEFLSEVVRRTGCGLLVDLENVRVNAENHGLSTRDLLDRLPLESIYQVHLAGGMEDAGVAHDTHTEPISEATWDLYEHLCELVRPPAVTIERDGNWPPFGELLGEVRRARRAWERAA